MKAKTKATLLLVLTTFFVVSCTELVPVNFDPEFYEFNPRGDANGPYIINRHKNKYYCNEPRVRKEIAGLHIEKIIELRNILRNAKVPKGDAKKSKKNILNHLNDLIKKMQK